jgi:hypothetical protein
MGYIITNNPTAILPVNTSFSHFIPPTWSLGRIEGNIPIGTLTPTNFPFCNAGPVFGTKFPRMIPMAIAKKIHNARRRSSQPRLLKIDVLEASNASSSSVKPCFSTSEVWGLLEDGGEDETTTSSEGRTLGCIFLFLDFSVGENFFFFNNNSRWKFLKMLIKEASNQTQRVEPSFHSLGE